ncbi:MAG: phosphate acetyltransferase [Lachnospiraceae bacterium]|nr:phosphate acetyltransferase [Lachnospiraceae bacterium]
MSMIERVKEKARSDRKSIAFPEGSEERTILAAGELVREGIADPILIGNADEIRAEAERLGVGLAGIRIEDPSGNEAGSPDKVQADALQGSPEAVSAGSLMERSDSSTKAKKYADLLYELRKSKGMTPEAAREQVADPMYYGIMMVKAGDADGLVSGAVHTTGDMLRPALQIIKTKPGMKIVSSSFLMDCPDKNIGADGLLVYADCVVVPCPNAEELACIAIAAADTARTLCGIEEPRVAMLSFSTKGSAKHEMVSKVQRAVEIAHEMAPDLLLDGEMQFDAALVPEIAASKAKGSSVAGRANVLIFPDLQAGNIGYKITQRIGKADCFAVLQGLQRPCNDLSRGCTVEDIVNTAAMTAVQAQGM